MATTLLYVELIIIGLETMMWITSFSVCFTDIQYIFVIEKIIETLPASIFLLGVMYILGLIFDRIADLIFQKTESQIREKSGLKAKSSILIWTESKQEEYFKFTRSKIRILRSSVINIPLFVISIIINIIKYYQSQYSFLIFVVVTGCILSYFSWICYKQAITNFYNKARILEKDINKRDGKGRVNSNDAK